MEDALADVLPIGSDCCARCSRLVGLSRLYADLMGLRDWDLEVEHGPPLIDGAVAEIELHPERRLGRLRVDSHWDGLEPDDQRHAIAHELAHAMARDLMETVRTGTRDEFSGSAYRIFMGTVEREHEKLADLIAVAVGPVLPLP